MATTGLLQVINATIVASNNDSDTRCDFVLKKRCAEFPQDENIEGGPTISDVNPRRTLPTDVEKVHSTIKAIVRDWSGVCAEERKMSYSPILERLEAVFNGSEKEDVKVKLDLFELKYRYSFFFKIEPFKASFHPIQYR